MRLRCWRGRPSHPVPTQAAVVGRVGHHAFEKRCQQPRFFRYGPWRTQASAGVLHAWDMARGRAGKDSMAGREHQTGIIAAKITHARMPVAPIVPQCIRPGWQRPPPCSRPGWVMLHFHSTCARAHTCICLHVRDHAHVINHACIVQTSMHMQTRARTHTHTHLPAGGVRVRQHERGPPVHRPNCSPGLGPAVGLTDQAGRDSWLAGRGGPRPGVQVPS